MLSNYGVSHNHSSSSNHTHNHTTSPASQSDSSNFSQALSGFGSLGGGSEQTTLLLSLLKVVIQLLTQMQEQSACNACDTDTASDTNTAGDTDTDTDAACDTGNTGAADNTGNTGAAGNTGNTGAAGNTGNTGAAGNTGNTGAADNTGNTGAAGNTGNTGAVDNTGATDNTGTADNSGDTGTAGNNNAAPEVSISIPASTADSNTVQYCDTNGVWQTLDANNPPSQNLQPEDIRLSNNSQGTTIGGHSGGAQIVNNGDSFTINFEDRFNSSAPNDKDFNDVSVTIKNASADNSQDNDNVPAQETAPNTY